MTAPDRSVRSLRLRAGSEEEIGRVLPRLEDALRCASLPDTGSRMLLVRKLDLGGIDAHASVQTLSHLIELRMARTGVQWVPGGMDAADGAGFVSFDGALQARTQLALRLLRGEPCTGWYWPLAVPELRPHADRTRLLRRMAETIARLPEARAGLPAWAAALVAAGGAAQLVAAVDANLGEALLQQAGIPMRSPADEPSRRDPPPMATRASDGDSHAGAGALAGRRDKALPRWLQTLLIVAGYAARAGRTTTSRREDSTGSPKPGQSAAASLDTVRVLRQRVEPGDAARPAAPVSVRAAQPVPVAPATRETRFISAPAPPTDTPSLDAAPTGSQQGGALACAQAAVPTTAHPYLEPTACAGLLFLLPVLARSGLAAWSEQAGVRGERFADRVLMAALRRLDVATDDPAWTLMPIDLGDSEPLAVPAPSSWRDALLRAPHARRGEGELGDLLWPAESADVQAAVWLRATGRWLRRAAHIGLATLVLRPGFISVTPTHVDIHFRVDDTDLRVRRAGLDLDPGWLPWLGRVVGFHYSERWA